MVPEDWGLSLKIYDKITLASPPAIAETKVTPTLSVKPQMLTQDADISIKMVNAILR